MPALGPAGISPSQVGRFTRATPAGRSVGPSPVPTLAHHHHQPQQQYEYASGVPELHQWEHRHHHHHHHHHHRQLLALPAPLLATSSADHATPTAGTRQTYIILPAPSCGVRLVCATAAIQGENSHAAVPSTAAGAGAGTGTGTGTGAGTGAPGAPGVTCDDRDSSYGLISSPTTSSPSVAVSANPYSSPVSSVSSVSKMPWSDFYKSPRSPFAKLRSSLPHHHAALRFPPGFDPDLVSKDKIKQKDAVQKLLAERVRDDWDFKWPPAGDTKAPTHAPVVVVVVGDDDAAEVRLAAGEATSVARVHGDGGARDPEEETESVYSTASDDPERFRPRAEWASDLSDTEDDNDPIPGANRIPPATRPSRPSTHASSFRFESPDSVETTLQSSLLAAKELRRRALRDESKWNAGLACYETRRNAWTAARVVRLKPRLRSTLAPAVPASPTRRAMFWPRRLTRTETKTSRASATTATPTSPLSPVSTRLSSYSHSHSNSHATTTRGRPSADLAVITPPSSESESLQQQRSRSSTDSAALSPITGPSPSQTPAARLYSIETILPLTPPILPPQNPMRASVCPTIYPSLYDKIILHNLQPSCPVNLADMLRSCVVGWKRDGEWPPRMSVAAGAPTITAVPVPRSVPGVVKGDVGRRGAAMAALLRRRQEREQQQAHHRRSLLRTVESIPLRDETTRKDATALGSNIISPGIPKTAADVAATPATAMGTGAGGGHLGKGFRKSLQKVLSLGASSPPSPLAPTQYGNGNGVVAAAINDDAKSTGSPALALAAPSPASPVAAAAGVAAAPEVMAIG